MEAEDLMLKNGNRDRSKIGEGNPGNRLLYMYYFKRVIFTKVGV